MICNICGRNIENENANFCENCGTSLRGHVVEQNNTYQKESQIDNVNEKKEEQKPISFGNWMGSLILPFIPLVGPIIYLVMLFIWSFGSDTNQSKKNWARAQLIVTIISVVLVVYFIVTSVMTTLNGQSFEEFYKNYNNLYK